MAYILDDRCKYWWYRLARLWRNWYIRGHKWWKIIYGTVHWRNGDTNEPGDFGDNKEIENIVNFIDMD